MEMLDGLRADNSCDWEWKTVAFFLHCIDDTDRGREDA